jgi:hypothetical protein
MFKVARITILLFVLFMVAMGTWLTKLRSTDWNNSLWVKIYPINARGPPLRPQRRAPGAYRTRRNDFRAAAGHQQYKQHP